MDAQGRTGFVLARNDFERARRQAAMQAIMSRLTGKSAELLSFEHVRQQLRARGERAPVLQDIPLDAIVGSVGRYSDFTRSFLPLRDSAKDRWSRVKTAWAGMAGLPPIEVYQIGEAYFVKDGNHRVSVAQQLGISQIEAYVTEIPTRVPLTPDTQPDDLILKAEYADFLEHTGLDQLFPEADLRVTAPGQYEELEQHIEVHHYLMGVDQQRETSYAEAVAHWYNGFYLPVLQIVRERRVLRDFPGRTETDLYVWIVKHAVALEQELGWKIGLRSAALDLATRSSPRLRRILGRLSSRLLHAVTPGKLQTGPPPGQWRSQRLTDDQDRSLFADILVAVDGEESGWHALELALELARWESARLHGLCVVSSAEEKRREDAQAVQDEFERRLRAADIAGDLALDVGQAPDLIVERSRLVDLVILGFSHLFAPGSSARLSQGLSTITRRCATPVLAVPGPVSSLDRILLAYDGSPTAQEALFIATYLAGQGDIPLVVLTVMERGRTDRGTLARAQEYLDSRGVQARFVAQSGPVIANVLISAEESNVDLILMGGYGHNPIADIAFGSTVEQVLQSSGRPVLICR